MRIRLEFVPQDCWIGVYWKWYPPYSNSTCRNDYWNYLEVWICLVPCFPIHITRQGKPWEGTKT